MNAGDVMTRNVVTVTPETTVPDLVTILLSRNISGVPVVGEDGRLVGIVTEADLIRRAELGTEKQRGGWLSFFTATATLAQDYVRAHATKVGDLMSQSVISVARDTPLVEIADLMEDQHVRRVPVVEDDRVIGIVSRANLLRAWASLPAEPQPAGADDATVRARLLEELGQHAWSQRPENSIVVTNGVVHLWGLAASEDERRALELLAEQAAGARSVRNHIVVLDPQPYPMLLGI